MGTFLTSAVAAEKPDGTAISWPKESWTKYVERFIQADGRVIDPTVSPGVTTSEGQAYSMLRALWVDDRGAFDRLLGWSRDNLARKDSPLPAWKWGRRDDGSWGILDQNTASDADVIMAFALFVAGERWKAPELSRRGQELAAAIWKEEVARIGGQWLLLPGNWATDENPIPLNVSYYSPAMLRRLGAFDPTRPWADLAEATYRLLDVRLPTTGLPPDWILFQKVSGEFTIGSEEETLKGRFGPDAYRVYFNMALDYAWDRTPRAISWLRSQGWLVEFLRTNGTLPREVAIDAMPRLTGPEPIALHASLYPSLVLLHRDTSHQARKRIDEAYEEGLWGEPSDYYAQNLVWFGLALGDGLFPAPP